MGSYNYDKFADEVVELNVDASDILLNGDTIALLDVVVLSGGVAISSFNFAGTLITFRVTGGTAKTYAYAVVQVTTTFGLYRESPVQILIKPLPGA